MMKQMTVPSGYASGHRTGVRAPSAIGGWARQAAGSPTTRGSCPAPRRGAWSPGMAEIALDGLASGGVETPATRGHAVRGPGSG
jgi:hypothetical protein